MKAFYCDHFVLPLPEGHRFPMEKYAQLRERALSEVANGPTVFNRYLRNLRATLNDAIRDGHADDNPAKLVRIARRLRCEARSATCNACTRTIRFQVLRNFHHEASAPLQGQTSCRQT